MVEFERMAFNVRNLYSIEIVNKKSLRISLHCGQRELLDNYFFEYKTLEDAQTAFRHLMDTIEIVETLIYSNNH